MKQVVQVVDDITCAVVAFTPKGGCPLKRRHARGYRHARAGLVAFTPKGGCPLKQIEAQVAPFGGVQK